MRSKASSAGFGSWETGFTCPNIFIKEVNGALVDQGEAKIMAPLLKTPDSEQTRLGVNMEFTKTPKADSLIVKIGTKVNDKVYYIPYRYIQGDVAYNNPVRESKTLIGTFVADSLVKYSFKINLPYKIFGWYITDEESNKMKDSINEKGVEARGVVNGIVSDISKKAVIYLQKKSLLVAASTDKAEFDAKLKSQEDQSKKIDTQLEDLKTQIEEARGAAFAKLNGVQNSIKALNAANGAVTSTSLQMNNAEMDVKALKTPDEELLATKKKNFEESKNLMDGFYVILNKQIPSKKSIIEASRADLLDSKKMEAMLSGSYPIL